MKIAILTTKNQWFEAYADTLSEKLGNIPIFNNHADFDDKYDIVFILSYHQIIPQEILNKNKHNIVIHASALPKGKGWAPLFWQVLEGRNNIPFTMIEASDGVDNGDIYMQDMLELVGDELNKELRDKQAKLTIKMCLEFVNNYEQYKSPVKQSGDESFYAKRSKEDSELDIDKTIKEQFNLLRIVNNNEYPAYFELDGNRYILNIELDKSGGVELIDFVDLTLDEKLMVLDWRNSTNVREWMYSQNEISVETHINFIGNLFFSLDSQYAVVKQDSNYLGVVDFTKIDNSKKQCFFGLYTNPYNKTIGLGKTLVRMSIKYAFNLLGLKKIKLEVFDNNNRAKNLYKKFNFKEVCTKRVAKQDVACMELLK